MMFLLMVITVIVALTLFSIKRPTNFPPGPNWFPIIGNSLELRNLSKKLGGLHLALLELSKQHKSDLLGLKLGNKLIVTVLSYSTIKAVLSKDEFIARPVNSFTKVRCLGNIKGIVSAEGELWNVQKHFVLKNIRKLGFGKQTEQFIQDELIDIKHEISLNENANLEKLLSTGVLSVLWTIIAGARLNKNNLQFKELMDIFENRGKLFDASGGILAHYPWLRYIAPERSGYNAMRYINMELSNFARKTINEHYQTWSEAKDSDIIYSFITEIKKEDSHSSFTDDQLLMLTLDLFIAGSQTTSTTLNFAMYMMLQYPDVQARVQHILDEESKTDQPLSYADRRKFTYIEAVLLEVERYCNVVPVIGPRRALKDTTINGYTIPKDTIILIHTQALHLSNRYWEEPEKFKPERFLTLDGNLVHHEELLTFSGGKRKCLGESLARRFIFIFFTEILKKYSIIEAPGRTEIITDEMIHSIKYSAKFVERIRT